MVIFEISLILLVIMNAIAFFNGIFGPALRDGKRFGAQFSVSILVPARNEEKNITQCLKSLTRQEYPDMEILVLDDHSTDETAKLVEDIARTDSRVHLIKGKELPPGWTGKNWACFQLAEQAKNDIFVFTDADTYHASDAVMKSVSWMDARQLDFLSAFPQQKTVTFIEKLVVPMIDFLVYALLPLWFTRWFSSPALSAANGQWVVFKREAYIQTGGHEAVKNEIVEDVELQKTAKKNKLKTLTLSGTDTVFCRMYHSPHEVWHGFSKNFFGLTGKSLIIFALFISFFGISSLFPYLILFFPGQPYVFALLLIGLNVWLRLFLAWRFKHPLIISAILHPLAVIVALGIGINSYINFKKGFFYWKDRAIAVR